MTPEEIIFNELGFGNLNILKLPHSIINMEAGELSKAIRKALKAEREETDKKVERLKKEIASKNKIIESFKED